MSWSEHQDSIMSEQNILSQSPGLSFRLQQGQDVSLPHGSLHVPDDLTVSLTNELHLHLRLRSRSIIKSNISDQRTYLGTLTLGTSSTQNFDDSSEDDSGLVHVAFRRALTV